MRRLKLISKADLEFKAKQTKSPNQLFWFGDFILVTVKDRSSESMSPATVFYWAKL